MLLFASTLRITFASTMNWLNEPTTWRKDDSTPKTDFWRLTHDGGIRDSGHFFHQSASGDFVMTAIVEGAYREQYDQSGLMIRLNETDWIKCGIEVVDGKQFVSAVVTRSTSDWSKLLAPKSDSLTFRIQRTRDLVEIFYGEPNSKLELYRQTSFSSENPIQVGLMTASPSGTGFSTEFSEWSIES